jgi:hypothetical protein
MGGHGILMGGPLAFPPAAGTKELETAGRSVSPRTARLPSFRGESKMTRENCL